MNKFIYITFLFIFVVACNNELKINTKNEIVIDSINSFNYSVFRHIIYNNTNCIMYVNKKGDINIFNENGKLLFKKSVKNIINNWYIKERIHANLFSNIINNNCFFFVYNTKIIAKLSNDSLYLFPIYNEIDTTNKWELFSLSTSPIIKLSDSMLLLSVMRYIDISTAKGRNLFFNKPFLATVTLKDNNAVIQNLNIPFPYITRKDFKCYRDELLVYCYYYNNILYTIHRTPYIYRYNLITQKIDSFFISTKYIKESEIVPFDENFINNNNYYNEVNEYSLRSPNFHKLIYNPIRNEIYRINIIKSERYTKDGRKNKCYNWSVSVIDTNLKLIGEIPFLNDSLYNFYNFIPSSKGFIVAYKQTKEDIRLKRTRLCEFEISY